MTAKDLIDTYIKFFEERGHKRIANSPLVPKDDPTTLFTSAGMQPLIPYLLGEPHPSGKRLVNVQNSFRAQDIDEVGDNRHTTFFRMLGNWSLGDYFKKEEIPWLFKFLTDSLALDPRRLYISVFEGDKNVPRDEESAEIWKEIFEKAGVDTESRIFYCGVHDNWWSRSGIPENMPPGEIGGPDSEVYFDLKPQDGEVKGSFKELSDSGRLLEIGNSVFIQYQKTDSGEFKKLPQQNVDFGAGVERLLAAVENKQDMFQTSLFVPVIQSIEKETDKPYKGHEKEMRIIADHLRGAAMLISESVVPSNKEQGYVLRRLLRRSFDNWHRLDGKDITPVISAIVESGDKIDNIRKVITDEKENYENTIQRAEKAVNKDTKFLTPEEAFKMFTTHGLSPSQIKDRGYEFNEEAFGKLMTTHKDVSRAGATKKFAGGLADTSEATVRGHTATHLLHQAIRDLLGTDVHQTGSNITTERVRFDFNYDKALTDEEIDKLEKVVNEKIKENLAVHFEMLPLAKAKELGAIGLFDEKYESDVKVYFIGDYSKEFCGGPHVSFTNKVKSFKIIKQENLGRGKRRIYAKTG